MKWKWWDVSQTVSQLNHLFDLIQYECVTHSSVWDIDLGSSSCLRHSSVIASTHSAPTTLKWQIVSFEVRRQNKTIDLPASCCLAGKIFGHRTRSQGLHLCHRSPENIILEWLNVILAYHILSSQQSSHRNMAGVGRDIIESHHYLELRLVWRHHRFIEGLENELNGL